MRFLTIVPYFKVMPPVWAHVPSERHCDALRIAEIWIHLLAVETLMSSQAQTLHLERFGMESTAAIGRCGGESCRVAGQC